MRCDLSIKEILPGETSKQEGVILFLNGDHRDLLERYKKLVPDSRWE